MDDPGGRRTDNESPDAAITATADAQFGVFARAQALDAGLSERQIQVRLSARRWAPETMQQAAMAALESSLEAKVWLLLQQSMLPLPRRQFWVVLPGGRYRVDFAWPEQRVALECDGWEHHGRRSAFAPDRARLAEFAAARWRVLPITWHACTREPQRVERWLRAALADSVATGRPWK